MPQAHTLDRITAVAPAIDGLWARDVLPGDWIIVHTKNSVYALSALGRDRFLVSGGWFSAEHCDNTTVSVAGCTFGGNAIITGLLAAPGLFVEFSNGVVTTRIRKVELIRGGEPLAIH